MPPIPHQKPTTEEPIPHQKPTEAPIPLLKTTESVQELEGDEMPQCASHW